MYQKQIKSRSRVREHGEVFTSEKEVKAMCDLAKDECERVDSRVLEPACGNGNFLAEILTRKLHTVSRYYSRFPDEWEKNSILALASIYGIDIMEDNTEECKARLYSIWEASHKNAVGKNAIEGIYESARYLLDTNILCGDALTLLQSNGKPIVFAEWNLVKGIFIKRRDFELAAMLQVQENGKQGDLFLSTDDYDEEIGAYIPNPIREYKPIEYWRLPCLK